jgi:hypothetical protein
MNVVRTDSSLAANWLVNGLAMGEQIPKEISGPGFRVLERSI